MWNKVIDWLRANKTGVAIVILLYLIGFFAFGAPVVHEGMKWSDEQKLHVKSLADMCRATNDIDNSYVRLTDTATGMVLNLHCKEVVTLDSELDGAPEVSEDDTEGLDDDESDEAQTSGELVA